MTGIQKYKRAARNLILFMLGLPLLSTNSSAQGELPDTPDMIRVTVEHATNYVLIQWEASEDPDIDLYHIYRMDNGTGSKIFSFDSETFEYYHMTSGLENLAYSVTAEDTLDGSRSRESLLGENEHRAVAVSLEFDPCISSNIINWSGYVGWEGNTSGYRIYGGLKGDEMEMLTFVHPNTRTWTHKGISFDTSYNYYVEAVHTPDTITSLSPIEEIRTALPEAPELLRIDEVTVIDNNSIEVRFTADVEGPVNDFRILRRSDRDSPFSVVGTIWESGYSNMDFLDHVFAQSNSYEYLIQSIYQPESCVQPITLSQSNVGTSILLESQLVGQVAQLTWTPYESYSTGLSGYIIQRKTGNGEFIDVASVGAETTSWQESVESVSNGYQSGEVQYKVMALSYQVEGTDSGISVSNIVSVFMETSMQIPNAFTPGRTANYLFKPVIDFAPSKYRMTIYERGGRKLFETDDPSLGWDGTFGGGGYAMEGVYVYFIQYTDFTGLSRTLSGNVTVIYPPEY